MTSLIVYKTKNIPEPSPALVERLNLDNAKWKRLQMNKVAPLIKKWKVTLLSVRWNYEKGIFKQISSINFPELITLLLNGNNIHSIEGLSRIRMPKLRVLSLSTSVDIEGENKINCTSELRKTRWKQLENVYIGTNKIKDLAVFSLIQSSKIRIIMNEYHTVEEQQGCSINALMKLQTNQFQELRINSQQRIKERKIEKVLKQKNFGLEVFCQ